MWRILDTGIASGTINMAMDESLALQLNSGECPPTLRLYGWSPFAVSIGKNQPSSDFNLTRLSLAGIDLVRRPTGGRAILHANEITYAVVVPANGTSPRSIYQRINECLLSGLHHMGILAELALGSADFRSQYSHSSSIPCFSLSAKSEVHFRGKKLIGSAQRRFGDTVLQHGSLLLGPEHKQIVKYISTSSPRLREEIKQQLDEKTIDASTILGRPMTFEEAARCLRKGFETSTALSSVVEPNLMEN